MRFYVSPEFMNKPTIITRLSFLLTASLFLGACATTPEGKLKQAYKRAAKTPFDQLPALYVQLEREEKITQATRKAWADTWGVDNKKREAYRIAWERGQKRQAEQKRRWWASLTPAQRFDLEMREREMQQRQSQIVWQAEQQRQANAQAAFSNLQQNLQRQDEVNAYNERTRALSQPVNVHHSGTINQNVNGRINIYGY